MSSASTKSGRDWARELVAYYSDGYSDAEVSAEMKMPIREYYKQIEENPTFAKLVEFGRTLSQAHWEGLARKNIANKQFNSPLYAFYMKNRHGWADKIETRTEIDSTTYNVDETRAKVSKLVDDYIKKNTPELTDARRVLEVPVEALTEGWADEQDRTE